MRHRLHGRKLNRTTKHRKALWRNLAQALIRHEQIETTLPKAKDLRPIVEKLITAGRPGDLAARRYLIAEIQDEALVEKVLSVLAVRYKDRPGGYTRILKMGPRPGDNAERAIIEFVDRDITAKGRDDRARVAAELAAADVA
jgi:large subunit ribosomal protein L17